MSLLRRAREIASTLTFPLHLDDLLGVLDPLASGRQLRAQVARVEHPTQSSATIFLRPGRGWVRHQAGQWIRIGVDLDGVRHWRSYSLSSAAGTMPAITVTDIGRVSGELVRRTKAGDVLPIALPQGDFVLPDTPRPLLFLTGGSGITPVMSMLRTLLHHRDDADVVLLHSAPGPGDDLFSDELVALDARYPGFTLVRRYTRAHGRLALDDARELDALVPDWRARSAYVCGPESLLESATRLWARSDTDHPLTVERFAPPARPETVPGTRATVSFTVSDRELVSDGAAPILESAEAAGLLMPSGCRMGICRTCLSTLVSGQVRDLVTGEVHGEPGDLIRTCVSAPVGDVTLDR